MTVTVKAFRRSEKHFPGEFINGCTVYDTSGHLAGLHKAQETLMKGSTREDDKVYETIFWDRCGPTTRWWRLCPDDGCFIAVSDPRVRKTTKATARGFARPENNGEVECEVSRDGPRLTAEDWRGTVHVEDLGRAEQRPPEGQSFPYQPAGRPGRLAVAMDFTNIEKGTPIIGSMPCLREDELRSGAVVNRHVRTADGPLDLAFLVVEVYQGRAVYCILQGGSSAPLQYVPGWRPAT